MVMLLSGLVILTGVVDFVGNCTIGMLSWSSSLVVAVFLVMCRVFWCKLLVFLIDGARQGAGCV